MTELAESRSLGFACLAIPGHSEAEALTLARSLRTFGGAFEQSPIWILVPVGVRALSSNTRSALAELGARVLPFYMPAVARKFPYATKVYAARRAELAAAGEVAILAWLDSDVIIVRPPSPFALAENIQLAYRPVDHAAIGSLWDASVDGFWQLLYKKCAVAPERVFAMTTSVKQTRIRAYFNAGVLVVRTAAGLLARWCETFERLYLDTDFVPYYEKHILYRIFMHQVALVGAWLPLLNAPDIQELPASVNYPLNLHHEYPPERRFRDLNDVISFRYDEYFSSPAWRDSLDAKDPLRSWLEAQPLTQRSARDEN